MVVLLLEDVLVPSPPRPVVVALDDPPGPDTEADADTLMPEAVTVAVAVEDVAEADCAVEKGNKAHKAKRRRPLVCILTKQVGHGSGTMIKFVLQENKRSVRVRMSPVQKRKDVEKYLNETLRDGKGGTVSGGCSR